MKNQKCLGYFRICKGKGIPKLEVKEADLKHSFCIDCAKQYCLELEGYNKKVLEAMIGIVEGLSHLEVTQLNSGDKLNGN